MDKQVVFDCSSKKLSLNEIPHTEEIISNEQRINELRMNLSETDYKILKYIEGNLDESEFQSIKNQRQEWRDEINKLEVML